MTPTPQFETAWREHRPFLVDLAFRMLGNIGEAEDAVQDGFARLLDADMAAIDDVRGWLVVVVSRRCVDVLRSAHNRHRAGPLAGEDAAGGADPPDRGTLDDSVPLAL